MMKSKEWFVNVSMGHSMEHILQERLSELIGRFCNFCTLLLTLLTLVATQLTIVD